MHIGNYFGAIQNWVKMQDEHECFYGIVDLHAMTMPYDPDVLRKNTKKMAVDLMACGIDPKKSTLFIQSLVPEHLELYWILSCIYPYGELTRMVQFKEKSAQLKEGKYASSDDYLSAGLFTYPVLQAADILIYQADLVPVGKDQTQHLEGSRTLAERFNSRFKTDIFTVPKPALTKTSKIMSLADPEKKMSKSLGHRHFIGLFEEESVIRKKVGSAVTDTGPSASMSAGVENLFTILTACEDDVPGLPKRSPALTKSYEDKSLKYADLKGATADAVVALTGGFRKRRAELEKDKKELWDTVVAMSAKAQAIAADTLRKARTAAGLPNVSRRK